MKNFNQEIMKIRREMDNINGRKKQARNGKPVISTAIPELMVHVSNVSALLLDRDLYKTSYSEDKEIAQACYDLARCSRRIIAEMRAVADRRTTCSIGFGSIIDSLQYIEKQLDNVTGYIQVCK